MSLTIELIHNVIFKRCNDGKRHSRLPCLYEKWPPVVCAVLRHVSADRDPVRASAVALRLRSCRLGPEVQESKTKGNPGKDNFRDDLKASACFFHTHLFHFFHFAQRFHVAGVELEDHLIV